MPSDTEFGRLRRFARRIAFTGSGPGTAVLGATADRRAEPTAGSHRGPGTLLRPFDGLLSTAGIDVGGPRLDLSYLHLQPSIVRTGDDGAHGARSSGTGPTSAPTPASTDATSDGRGESADGTAELRVADLLDASRDRRTALRADEDEHGGDATPDVGDATPDVGGDAPRVGESSGTSPRGVPTARTLRTVERTVGPASNGGLELAVAAGPQRGAVGSGARSTADVPTLRGDHRVLEGVTETGGPARGDATDRTRPTTLHVADQGTALGPGAASGAGSGTRDSRSAPATAATGGATASTLGSTGERDGPSGGRATLQAGSSRPSTPQLTVRSPSPSGDEANRSRTANGRSTPDAPGRQPARDGRSAVGEPRDDPATTDRGGPGDRASASSPEHATDPLAILQQHDERRQSFVDELYRALERKRAIDGRRGPN